MAVNDMANFETPSKRIKYDVDAEWDDIDDLDDITAEEFDALELQATQQLEKEKNELNQKETSKNEIYAIEGKIMFQKELLKKKEEELNKEHLLKNKLLTELNEKFEKEQKTLGAKIVQLQTSLEFKERDLLREHEKVRNLRQSIETLKKNSLTQQVSQCSKNNFLNKFDFGEHNKTTSDSSAQTNLLSSSRKKYRLSLKSSHSKRQGENVLANLLISRQQNCLFHLLNKQALTKLPEEFNCLASNLARLGVNLGNENVWEEYEKLLSYHITFLRNASFLNQKCDLEFTQMSMGQSSSIGDLSFLANVDINSQHNIIIQCLTDVKHLFSWNCPPMKSSPLNNALEHYEQIKQQVEQEISACSAPLFNFTEIPSQEPPCLVALLTLAKKDTYPEYYEYEYRKKEMSAALTALSAWSSYSLSNLIPHVYHLPWHSFLSGQLDIKFSITSLELLTNIVSMNGFKDTLHQEDSCILTSVASLCHIILNASPEDSTTLLNLVECFLCSIIATLGNGVLQNEKCQCSSQVVQGFILMLWHQFQILDSTLLMNGIQTIEKGIITLYQLFNIVKNFREKRLPVEYQYVTLICGLSRLTKEHKELKSFHNDIRELWDFQEDGDEFESDEFSATPCA